MATALKQAIERDDFNEERFITLTRELIDSYQTKNGGWTRKVLESFGVSWPPQQGWKRRLIGTKIQKSKLLARQQSIEFQDADRER